QTLSGFGRQEYGLSRRSGRWPKCRNSGHALRACAFRVRDIARPNAAERVHRQRCLRDEFDETIPAQCCGLRMTGRTHYRTEHGEIYTDGGGVREFARIVAGRGDPAIQWQRARSKTQQVFGGQMHARIQFRSQLDIAIDQYLRAHGIRELARRTREYAPACGRHTLATQLDASFADTEQT